MQNNYIQQESKLKDIIILYFRLIFFNV